MTTTTRRDNRPTGAIARVLDPEALLAAAREVLAEQYPATDQHPAADPAQLTHGQLPQMLFSVDRNEAAIVCGEGTGYIANDDDTIKVLFSYGFNWIPVRLTLEQVGHAVTEETIDLADGIRVFGDRLDANHFGWFRRYHSYL